MAGANKLTALGVSKLTKKGMHSDGEGLYLRIDGSRHWVFVYFVRKKRREMGLGPLSEVSLAEARELKREARTLVRAGKDPIEERRRAKAGAVSFGALAHKVGDAVERAYRRGDALEKRRRLMSDWAKYCSAT